MWPEGEVEEYEVLVNSSVGAESMPVKVSISVWSNGVLQRLLVSDCRGCAQ